MILIILARLQIRVKYVIMYMYCQYSKVNTGICTYYFAKSRESEGFTVRREFTTHLLEIALFTLLTDMLISSYVVVCSPIISTRDIQL